MRGHLVVLYAASVGLMLGLLVLFVTTPMQTPPVPMSAPSAVYPVYPTQDPIFAIVARGEATKLVPTPTSTPWPTATYQTYIPPTPTPFTPTVGDDGP